MTSKLDIVIDSDPQPVDKVPAPAPSIIGGRNKTPEYVRLQGKLALRPGVPHKIAVLPAGTPKETAVSRHKASALRGTMKRYGVTLEERKLDGVITLYGTYTNGTAKS